MKAFIEIIKGVEGNCIGIAHEKDEGGRRVAGSKPWGGGRVLEKYTTTVEDILEAFPLEEIKKFVEGKTGKAGG